MSRQFSGSNYLYASPGDYFAGLGAITFSSWVWRSASGQMCAAFGCGVNSSYVIGLTWYGPDNRVYIDVRNGGAGSGYSAALTSTGHVHIAGTFDGSLSDGSRFKIFINGDDATSGQTASGQPSVISTFGISDQSLRLGRLGALSFMSANGSTQSYTQVFNTALNRTGIRESMRFPRRIAGSTTCLNSWALDISNTVGTISPGGGIWERDLTGRRDMDSFTTVSNTTQPPIMIA